MAGYFMSKDRIFAAGIIFMLSGFLACGIAQAQQKIKIYTSNYPLAYFAMRIAGENADVVFPAPGDVDPVFWQPAPEIIGEYQQADVIFLNGAGYEKWTSFAFLPASRMVDTSRTFSDRYLVNSEATTHSHGPTGDHSHRGVAWTTWLDFDFALLQAAEIRDTLIRKLPGQRDSLESNFHDLESDIRALDAAMLEVSGEGTDLAVLASHPVYQYLARRYGIRIESVFWEPGIDPGEEQWVLLGELAARLGMNKMLWESQPLPATESRLQEMGIRSIVYDPGANVPDTGDWLMVMQSNLENLKKNIQ
jgi:zinc transport system substrate-binding protein